MYARNWRDAPAICDRCQTRTTQGQLRRQPVDGRVTSLRVCPSCYDEDNPQWQVRLVRPIDPQRLPYPRSEQVDATAPLDNRLYWGDNPLVWGDFNPMTWED